MSLPLALSFLVGPPRGGPRKVLYIDGEMPAETMAGATGGDCRRVCATAAPQMIFFSDSNLGLVAHKVCPTLERSRAKRGSINR